MAHLGVSHSWTSPVAIQTNKPALKKETNQEKHRNLNFYNSKLSLKISLMLMSINSAALASRPNAEVSRSQKFFGLGLGVGEGTAKELNHFYLENMLKRSPPNRAKADVAEDAESGGNLFTKTRWAFPTDKPEETLARLFREHQKSLNRKNRLEHAEGVLRQPCRLSETTLP